MRIKEYNLYSYGFEDSKLYTTRNAIIKAQERKFECGRINWEGFDRLVAITRQDISEQLERRKEVKPEEKPKKLKLMYGICAYSLTTNELIGKYKSVMDASSQLNLNHKTIENALYKRNGMYKKGDMKFIRKFI